MIGAITAAVFCALVTAINLAGLAITVVRCRRTGRRLPPPADAPAVSIVRPLCGVDPFIETTLLSGFRLDYPQYELIFDVARATDPVIPIAERLMAAHPAIPCRIIVGEEIVNGNPKLNNCVKGWDAARHAWIIFADHNVQMPADYIQQMLAAWQPRTGLVCATPIGSHPQTFWAHVECAFLNTLQARWQYVGEAFGAGFAQGKNMLWRRDILEANGGIRALGAEIAEDAAATKLLRRAGYTVNVVQSPFDQPLGERNAREVWSRQARWARLRRVTFPLFFTPEILSGGAAAFLAGLAAVLALEVSLPAYLSGFAVLWYGVEALTAWAIGWPVSWQTIPALIMRDLMIPVLWVRAWVTRDVEWRGNAMSVGATQQPITHSS